MNAIVVIQARTNSSRLPAKVLLPIKDVPMVVLAAKRAANKGAQVIVVTSEESTDDELSRVLDRYNISYFRGSLDNTLKRFIDALSDFDDEQIVVRLTADNVFPDGDLLLKLEKHFIENDLNYLICNGEKSGMPYGVSAELMKLKHLREALIYATEPDQFEHVTPYLRKKFSEIYYREYSSLSMGDFRCTVDTLDDYLLVTKIFNEVLEPIQADLFELLNILKKVNTPNKNINKELRKLVLGGAQFGGNYGINNVTGKPDIDQIRTILHKAYRTGIRVIDTARAYGDSEDVIGQTLQKHSNRGGEFRIVTKLSPLSEFNSIESETSFKEVERAVENSVLTSLFVLQMDSLDCLILHRVNHLTAFDGIVWDYLKKMKSEGRIQSLGVSVQTPEELEQALSFIDVEHLQLPFNLLDFRWEKGIQTIREIKANRNLVVHARSALLQGLLITDDSSLWSRAGVDEPNEIIRWLNRKVIEHNLESVAELCLAYVRSQDWIDGVVVGMETLTQLEQNIYLFSKEMLSQSTLDDIRNSKPLVSEQTLNPALWSI